MLKLPIGIQTLSERLGLFRLGYPNREVRESFLNYLLAGYAKIESNRSKPIIFKLEDAFKANDLELAMNLSNQLFRSLPHQLHDKSERFYHAIIHLTYFYLGIYIESEVNTAFGRADAVVQTDTHVYCFELGEIGCWQLAFCFWQLAVGVLLLAVDG